MAARDTICALASGALPSAIALVRVSGDDVSAIIERLLSAELKPRRATLSKISDYDGQLIY